jgi:hypothetical protein
MDEKCRFPVHCLTLFESINKPLEPFHKEWIRRVFPSLTDICLEFAPYSNDRASDKIVRRIKRDYATMYQHADRLELHYDSYGSRSVVGIVFVELFSGYT